MPCRPDPADGEDADRELAHRAVLHGDAIVAIVEDADIAERVFVGTARKLGAVAVDRVAVQIEGDVVGPDHDALVWTVAEIPVKRRVLPDLLPAAYVASAVLTPLPTARDPAPTSAKTTAPIATVARRGESDGWT